MALPLLEFFATKNLTSKAMFAGNPWDFAPTKPDLERVRKLPKEKRRAFTLDPKTDWNIYSPFRALAPNLRVSSTNPPIAIRGLVFDYDMVSDIATVEKYVNQLPSNLQPQFWETSLGMKGRTVYVFEREINLPGSIEYAAEFLRLMAKRLQADTLLPGYDAASEKPTEVWTNGGEWYGLKETPLPWEFVFGVAVEAARKTAQFARAEIPLTTIAEEVNKRFPGRWQGPFEEGRQGVRFWDPAADCPTGCQVKPEGMLCFTGTQGWVTWSEIFGATWVSEQRAVHLGKAGEGVFFDGKNYWEDRGGHRYSTLTRTDAILLLKTRGLSDKTPKGLTVSDAERVLRFIQQESRVDGVAPLINKPPGLVELRGRKLLNISTVKALEPAPESECTGDPEKDFPFIFTLFNGFFARPELKPREHFLAWLKRSYTAIRDYREDMGHAVFFCGPKNNGKTLISRRIVAPLLGDRFANPAAYFLGRSPFTDHIFDATLLACDDEEGPTNESEKAKFNSSVKSFVVNPEHVWHPKFCAQVMVNWCGRIVITTNDDPSSTGMLPEVNGNTADKLMFFASKPFDGEFAERHTLEPMIAKELPKFARWLLSWQPPAEVIEQSRVGVKSYFDPVILELSQQQVFAYNLRELLDSWMSQDEMFGGEKPQAFWEGTPTDLLNRINVCDALARVAREWTTAKVAKSLIMLAKAGKQGVEFAGDEGQRVFRIYRDVKKQIQTT